LDILFDTRGYTEDASLHLQSSPIEEESINALAVFFHVAPFPDFSLETFWDVNDLDFQSMRTPEELCKLYHDQWVEVGSRARSLWEERRA